MKLNKRSLQEGSILVEMAFTLPIFAIIFLIIVDGGLAIREHQLLQNATREGARYGSLKGATDDQIKQKVADYCAKENLTINAATDVTITPQDIPVGGGGIMQAKIVSVSCSRNLLILGAPLLPSSTINLSATSVFRNLY